MCELDVKMFVVVFRIIIVIIIVMKIMIVFIIMFEIVIVMKVLGYNGIQLKLKQMF